MKKTTYMVAAAFWALSTLAGCTDDAASGPEFEQANLKAAVQGRWAVERIDYRLCRNSNCNTRHYPGTAQDYVEFKVDSAYLLHAGSANGTAKEAFRADYSQPGAILLSSPGWTGRFDVRVLQSKELVLENTFPGRDPEAVFTDTYYLKR